MNAELNQAEQELVAILLDLYNEALTEQYANHEGSCVCNFCKTMNEAGEYSFKVFDSLQEKTNQ